MSGGGTHRVLVVDDDRFVGAAIARHLQTYAVVTRVETFGAGQDALLARAYQGLVVDVRLPDGNGIDLIALARGTEHRAPAAVISGFTVDEMKEQVNRASDLGDTRFLFKPVSSASLLNFVLSTYAAQPRFAQAIEAFLHALPRFGKLPMREAVCIELMLCGHSKREIADGRGIEEKTVEKYIGFGVATLGFDSAATMVRALLRVLSGT